MRSSNNKSRGIAEKIVEVIMINEDKKIKMNIWI